MKFIILNSNNNKTTNNDKQQYDTIRYDKGIMIIYATWFG